MVNLKLLSQTTRETRVWRLFPSACRCAPQSALSLATEPKRVIVQSLEVACADGTDEHQDHHFQATSLAERCRSLASSCRLSGGDRRRADRGFVLFGLPSRIDGNFRACAVWIRGRDGNHRSFGPRGGARARCGRPRLTNWASGPVAKDRTCSLTFVPFAGPNRHAIRRVPFRC